MRSGALQRRLVTIPRTAVLFLSLTILFPLLLVVTGAVDLVRGLVTRKPWTATRLLTIGWVYLAGQMVVVFVSGFQWLAALPTGSKRPAKLAEGAYDLQESSPELYKIMEGHDQVLPPRTGGVLALLDSEMDVVFGIHTGLESLRGLKEIWREAPVGRRIQVTFRRVAAADIPVAASDRIRWLHEEWARVDDTIVGMQDD